MSPKGTWICDGEPKDGKQYPYCSGPHQPQENSGPDCIICGLPREAIDWSESPTVIIAPGWSYGSSTSSGWVKTLLAIAITCFLLAAVFAIIVSILPKSQPVTERKPRNDPTPERTSPVPEELVVREDYQHSEYGIEIKYPQTWTPEEVNRKTAIINETELVRFVSPQGSADHRAAQVTITRQEVWDGVTLKEYKDGAIKEIEDYSPYQVETISQITLGQRPAYQMVYSGYDGRNDLRIMQVFALKEDEDVVYIISYVASSGQYNQFLAEAEAMIESFEFSTGLRPFIR